MFKSIGEISAKAIGVATSKAKQREEQTAEEAKAQVQLRRYKNKVAGMKITQASLLLEEAGRLTSDLRIASHCNQYREKFNNYVQSLSKATSLKGGYIMLSIDQTRLVHKALKNLPPKYRPRTAKDVFYDAVLAIRYDSGLIETTRREIAERLSIPPERVSVAMTTLCRLHIFERRRREKGRGYDYFLNPNVGWRGNLTLQEKAAEKKLPPPPPTTRVLELISKPEEEKQTDNNET